MKGQFHKRIIGLICALFVIGILAACGNQEKTEENSSSEKKTEETITYKAANGDVKIPKHPKRVVLVADSYYGHFLTLGIQPVGAPQNVFDNPFFEGKTKGTENIGDGTSAEKILELKPDLIIAWTTYEGIDQLEKIAPTVAIEYSALNTKEQLKEFGKMTGTEEKADEWLASWDKKIAEAKPEVEKAVGDQTVALIQPYDKGINVFGSTFARGGEILYEEFDLKAPDLIQKEAIDSGAGYAQFSLEKLPEYAGDYIFTSPWSAEDDGTKTYNSQMWKDLPAVKNERVFEIHPIGFYFNDPISLEGQLEFIVENLTKS
ncbi:iron-hydroxamate ABC transporter substrate-binding protein [Metabacillus idriensis]|uniref:iron-hydroxamate ABC transporter substrate-binding protein n=1 Tax=Metabacillus idriensis TaxID=324768 RepID=UPI00174DA933|nr:iron-hydroxamate ABC transporter substrate-binding protein [Metabacillus idriensis]